MNTENHLATLPAVAGRSSCHRANKGSGSWVARHRGIIFGGGVIVAATALALNQHWVAAASLVPLLFVLPCAVMMFMCMKGMNHGQNTGGTQASTPADTPINAEPQN